MEENYLGTGWKFPVDVDPSTGRIQTVSGEDDIKESIRIILLTEYRERIMKSEFGSNMREYVFQGSSLLTYSSMQRDAKISVETWEPRVKNVEVNVFADKADDSIVRFEVKCAIRSTDTLINQIVELDI